MFVSNLLCVNWAERLSAKQALGSSVFDGFLTKSSKKLLFKGMKYSKTKTNVFACKNNVDYIKCLMTVTTITDSVRNTRRSKSEPSLDERIKKK